MSSQATPLPHGPDDPRSTGPTDASTRVVVDGVRSGTESFAELYRRVAPALLLWADVRIRPALRPWLEPEDLVQEVCCRAFRDFRNFDPARGRFRAWVFGIANHVLKRALLQLGRAPAPPGQGLLEDVTHIIEQLPDDATSVTRRASRDEQLRALGRELARFPEEDRQLVLCRGLEGLTHGEVSERLGLAVEVVKKRWQRLRARLADRLSPGLFEEPAG